ncbi:DUF4032 domain-containing protein [Blastococcus sp. PRF04-17]|uniref:DUF4032 domain-containing protein n=1 Tax=Blastococcus sp. PRF04-17 TaxID=2933797 RepID=UPI001FF44373|nr:DUF4032 domain-containing protein [Blastococcus sp. PRF04-17]UOY00178.1 DUF4032 domain-containing protein [Blastococcus sp. PRF04-17]
MRFVFRPSAAGAVELLGLPWSEPLEEWRDDALMTVPQRGISRHVVRFIASEGAVYALKELDERLARREYQLLGDFAEEGLPAVEALGICVERPDDLPAILVTRFLEYSMSYRYVFSRPGAEAPGRLIDTMAELLVRLHLAGIFWGDCSLSNTLFLPDAGTMSAYLVDAETVERHPSLSDGQRGYDLDLATERVAAELMDLAAGGLLPDDVDPIELAAALRDTYETLWAEVTCEEHLPAEQSGDRVVERVRRLGDLGFDAGEVELTTSPQGARLKVQTSVGEPGRHRHELFRLTGLEVQEHQARRLLDDLAGYRAWLEQRDGVALSDIVAGHRWVAEIYSPVVDAIPSHLAGRLAPPEVFHEILEHRWFLSEAAGGDVGTAEAAASYFADVLPLTPKEFTTPSVMAAELL